MTVMELGALGEFLGVFALVATLIYLSIQVRYARGESEKAVREARTVGSMELALSAATSDGLLAALVKADEAIGVAPNPFQSELMSRGLDSQEAHRVLRWYQAQWGLNQTHYESANQEQRDERGGYLRASYASGVGRLFWDNPKGAVGVQNTPFADHLNAFIDEADQQQDTQQ